MKKVYLVLFALLLVFSSCDNDDTDAAIEYPEFSEYGENILFGDKASFTGELSLAANTPKGLNLKIVIKGGSWGYVVLPRGPINWESSIYDSENQKQTFKVIETGKISDLIITFEPGTYTVEYYEDNADTPTRIKTITNQ